MTYQKARVMSPPLQALFPYYFEQSNNCCYENEISLLLIWKLSVYMAPLAEKAQQAPQLPWFFMPVTAPFFSQSTYSGILSVGA